MGGYIGARSGTISATVANVQDVTATDSTPEVTIVNNTHEDSDGGREGKLIFKGQQSGGEESTLAEIEANHHGSSDDEKANLIIRTNDGSDGSSPTERIRIDSGGNFLIGKSAVHEFDAYGTAIMMQLESSGTSPYAGFGMVQNSNDTDSAPLIFGKSRGTSAAATTIVQDGDILGRIEFQGMDGADLETGASIFGVVDGTPGANDMPGRLVFNTTADGAHSATERMRITHEGNVQIGTTTDRPDNYNGSGSGIEFAGLGLLRIARNGDVAVLNRVSTEGDILNFSKDGSGIGQIGVTASDVYICSTQSGHSGVRFHVDGLLPVDTSGALDDNQFDLGHPSYRWDDVYATNGTIQTSDERKKQQIASLTSTEITAAKAISKLFKTFKWNDSVETKGDNARTHTGVIAQQVEQAMSDAGLDVNNYSFFTNSTCWEIKTQIDATEEKEAYEQIDFVLKKEDAPEGATELNIKGIRYPELLAFIGAATEQRLTSIEARLTALEG